MRFLFCCLFISYGSFLAAVDFEWAQNFKHGSNVDQSIQFVRLTDGKILYEKNPDRVLIPASTTKLVTAAAVLTKFTPARHFVTKIYHTGVRQNQIITGDLIIVGDGDPFVVSENLWQLAVDFRNLGLKEFKGNIVIDNSLFDTNSRDESREFGQESSDNAYDAPVSAFGVNFNTVAVSVTPGQKPGTPIVAGLDPYPLKGVGFSSNAKTTAGKKSQIKVTRLSRPGPSSALALNISGEVSVDAPMRKVYRSIADSLKISGEYVRSFLLAEGIKVDGQVVAGVLPANAKPLYELESYEMSKLIAGLNKYSNNYIADVLLKRLGAAFPIKGPADAAGQGSYENGVHVLSDFLRNDAKTQPTFVIKNGSGLSTDNRLGASHLVKVLAFTFGRMDIFPEFIASLPASGWDGTLKERFQDAKSFAAQGLVRAKTGTLTSPVTVVSLAGFLRHEKHGLVAFAIIENGVVGKSQPTVDELRQNQDKALAGFMQSL